MFKGSRVKWRSGIGMEDDEGMEWVSEGNCLGNTTCFFINFKTILYKWEEMPVELVLSSTAAFL